MNQDIDAIGPFKIKTKIMDKCLMGNLDRILASLNKKYGKAIINQADEIKFPAVDRIPTGSLSIDLEIGGGIPKGRITMMVANESAGKSTLALKTAVEAQKLGLKVVYIDVEGAFDAEWAKALGVDISKLTVAIPDNGEMACDILEAVVRSGDCGLIILDSVAQLMPKAELEISMEDDPERLGNKAQMLNRAMRRLISAINMIDELGERNKTAIILINQFRQAIGVMYGPTEVIPGGKGIKFASSIILELRKGKWIEVKREGEDVKIGQEIKFKSSKNKTYIPMRTGITYLYFDGPRKGQIDRSREVYMYGRITGILKETGKAIFELDGKKFRGEDNVLSYLADNPKLLEKMEKDIRQVYCHGKS